MDSEIRRELIKEVRAAFKIKWSFNYRSWRWFSFSGVYVSSKFNGDRIVSFIFNLGPLRIKIGTPKINNHTIEDRSIYALNSERRSSSYRQ